MTHRPALSMALLALLATGCTPIESAGPPPAEPPGEPTTQGSERASAPSADGPSPRPTGEQVVGWELAAPDRLVVLFSGCEADAAVAADEAADEVSVLVHGPNGLCEPLFGRELVLAAPLGGRQVVDRSTGAVVQREVFGSPSGDALRRARDRWNDADIPHYRLDITVTSPKVASATAVIEVRDGQVRSRSVASLHSERLRQVPSTVDGVFARIEATIRDGQRGRAEYDVGTGHPTRVVIVDDPVAAPNGTTWFIALTRR